MESIIFVIMIHKLELCCANIHLAQYVTLTNCKIMANHGNTQVDVCGTAIPRHHQNIKMSIVQASNIKDLQHPSSAGYKLHHHGI